MLNLLDCLKMVERAKDDVESGDPQRALTYLEFAAHFLREIIGIDEYASLFPKAPVDEAWCFTVTSDEFGTEEFGSYDSKEDACDGIRRLQKRVTDKIQRTYSAPFQK